jgi:membrane associated rhomboid family serine protease
MLSVASTTLIIIVATCVVSFICFSDARRFYQLAFMPYEMKRSKQWYRMLSGGIVHSNYMHLIFNMLTLYSFGSYLEQYVNSILPFGNLGFLFFYVTAQIISHIPTYMRQYNNSAYVGVGASGAVSALLFAFIILHPWESILLFVIKIPAIIYGLVFLGISYYFMKRGGGGNIGHEVHYYGAIYGIIFMFIAQPKLISYFIEQLKNPHF